jgi:RNA polymerase sigma factor (sigma-70 family)
MTARQRHALLGEDESKRTWSDPQLVRACLDGDDEAWAALIEKYKVLIYSIPSRYGARPEDCADIFQMVCLDLFTELPKLRKPGALRSWLISVTAHASLRWKKRGRRRAEREDHDLDAIPPEPPIAATLVEDVEREQIVRDAVAGLPPRCREMIRMLFFEQPPLRYQEVAQQLGLATGSIGFIRGRCLRRLQRALEKDGF